LKLTNASPGIYPNRSLKETLNRTKFILRGLSSPKSTTALFELLEHPELAAIYSRFPRLAGKLQWPYLTCKQTSEEVLACLQAHYGFFRAHLPSSLRDSIASGREYTLTTLNLEDAESIRIVLMQSSYEKEGELAVSLKLGEDNATVCTASFTVAKCTGQTKVVVLGGLQGHHFHEEKSRIIAMTRAMKGMRPKALVLFAIQQMCITWDIQSLRAVGNAAHIYSSARKRKELAADYDLFWIESGGELQPDGLFNLPVIPPSRDISEIKANKRSTYRQRYALLDAVSLKIRAAASGIPLEEAKETTVASDSMMQG
jgi:uncharacterized protein VirK/YbjX